MAGGLVFVIIIGLVIGIAIEVAFLRLGVRIAQIEDVTDGQLWTTVILGSMATFVANLALFATPGVGLILGFLLQVLIMMSICHTTFGKALEATILAWVLMSVSVAILFLIFGVAAIANFFTLLFG